MKRPNYRLAIQLVFLLVYSITARSQVDVTATAGTPGPTTYTTLKGAFDAINAGTHQGNISVSITASTTETASAILNASGNGSALYTGVVIKPAANTNPVITGNVAAPLVKFNGSSNVTVDGSNTTGGVTRNLTISNTSTATGNGVMVIGSVGTTPINNVTVKNSTLFNGTNTTTALITSDATVPGTAGYFTNITIQNNAIQRAYIGMYLISVVSAASNNVLVTGNSINSTGTNAIRLVAVYAQGINGLTVSNNTLGNFSGIEGEYDRAIWLATATKNAQITGNSISGLTYTGTGAFAPIGINVSTGTLNSAVVISNNTINNITSSGTGNSTGIYVYTAMSDATISGNKINTIKNTNAGGYGAVGLFLAPTVTTAAIKVNNNFIWDVTGIGWNGYYVGDNGNGIVIDAGGGFDIYHNTVVMNTEQVVTGEHKSSCLLISPNVSSTGTLNLRDNILANLQAVGDGNSKFALSNAAFSGNAVFGTINNNDYYSTSGNLSNSGTVASIATSLAQLQTNLGGNANSLNALPIFVAPGDLHLSPTNIALSNSGTPLGITTDIDGDSRSATTPDMGADEFIPCAVVTIGTHPGNAAVCAGNDTSFTVVSPNGVLYQWQVNTGSGFNNITNNAIYGGATTPTLTLTGTPASYNGYTYRCAVNSFAVCNATNSNAATLTINPFPVGVITPASSTSLCPGGSVVLNANAGFTYQWQKNGVNTVPPTATINYTANSAGAYTVIITNPSTTCRDTSDPVNVIVNPTISTTKTITICNTQLPYTWNTQVLTAGGTGVATYTTPSLVTGCDSTTTLNLVVNTVVNVTKNLSICANQLPYTWNSIVVPAAGTGVATFTMPSSTGCDSTTTLNLSVNPLITVTKALTICQNQLPYNWNGIIVNGGGTGVAVYNTPSLVTGCDSATTLNLTVNPNPVVTATPNPSSICSGAATAINLTSSITGSTFSWTVVQTGVSGATANSGTSIAQTLTATGSVAGTAVYVITATANSCPSSPLRDTVTVKPAPAVVAAPTSQTICSGATSSVNLSSPVSGTTFAWTVAQANVTGASASNGSSITQTLTATTTTNGTATYTITPSANGCNGSNGSVVVTVTPVPAVPGTITGADAPCVGSSQTYSIASVTGSTSYIWTIPAGWTGTSTTNSITVTVGSASGTITVKSANSCGSSAAMTKTVTAVPIVTPTISISSNAPTPLCSGNPITFTANATNGGSTPVYQWKVNGTPTGVNSTTLQYAPANNDVITCTFTSNAPCATVTQVISNALTMQVTTSVVASLNIYIPENHICSGMPAEFVATPANGGTIPQYQWKVNNINSGTNSANFSYSPANNDIVTCEMTSNAVCATPVNVTSNPVPMTIVTVTHPAVTITSNPSSGMVNGQSVTFTANVTQGGTGMQVTWYKDDVYILGSGGTSWTGIAGVDFKNKNKIRARVQSLAPCADPDTAWSNTLNITIGTTGIADQELPDGFRIYPNPAKNLVNIEGLKPGDKASIYDALGGRISTLEIKKDNVATIDVSAFAQGIYFIHFTRENGKQWQARVVRD